MNALQLRWLKELGPQHALDWVTRMEDECIEEVHLMTPTSYDYSTNDPYINLESMPYTIEDFMEVAPKGVLHSSLDSLAFSK